MTASTNKYVLGKGKVYFAKFKDDGVTPGGERYLGNTPSLALTIETENLEHTNSDEGIKEVDASTPLSTSRKGSFETDNIDYRNIALFFFGNASILDIEADTGVEETVSGVEQGLYYQLGVTDDAPSGARKLANVVIEAPTAATGTITFSANPAADDTVTVNGTAFTAKASGATGNQFNIGADIAETALNLAAKLNASVVTGVALATYSSALGVVTVTYDTPGTAGNAFTLAKVGTNIAVSGATLTGGSAGATVTDDDTAYTVDLELGRIYIVPDGSIADGTNLDVTYDVEAHTREQVISGTTPVEGLMRFIAFNPVGPNKDYQMAWVKISPNGDYALKGDDWQKIPFNIEVLKKTGIPAIMVDGRPMAA